MYTVLDKSLKTIGFLTNHGSNGSTDFWDDQIEQQIADAQDVISGVNLTIESASSNIDPSGNSKWWNHTLTGITFDNTSLGRVIEQDYNLLYTDPSNKRSYLMHLTQVDESAVGAVHFKTASGVNAALYDLSRTLLKQKTFTMNAANTTQAINNGATYGSLKNILNYILAGSSWQLILDNDDYGAVSYEISDGMTAMQAMQEVSKEFDVDIDAYVQLKDNGSVDSSLYFTETNAIKRIIRIEKQMGTDNGRMIRYGKNMLSITKSGLSDALYTKLYVQGGNNATIAKANGGLTYITDDAANKNYNPVGASSTPQTYYEGVIVNEDIQAADALLAWGKKQLTLLNHPRYNYTVTTTDTDYSLGDTVRVQDREASSEILLKSRVIQKTFSFANKMNNQITLGEYSPVKVYGTDWYVQQSVTNIQAMVKSLLAGTSKYDVHVSYPDGTDFGVNDTEKRAIANVSVDGLNITSYVEPEGFVWTRRSSDGTVDEEWNNLPDNIAQGYMRMITPGLKGSLKLEIDTDYISTIPEIVWNNKQRTTFPVYSGKSIPTNMTNLAYGNNSYYLTRMSDATTMQTFLLYSGTTGTVYNAANDSLAPVYGDGINYFMNTRNELVQYSGAIDTDIDLLDTTNTVTVINRYDRPYKFEYDYITDTFLLNSGNYFGVFKKGNEQAEFSISNVVAAGLVSDIKKFDYSYPYVFVVDSTNRLNAFNIVTGSLIFRQDLSNVISGELLGIATNADGIEFAYSGDTKNIHEWYYTERDGFVGQTTIISQYEPNDVEGKELQMVSSKLATLKNANTTSFTFITDTHYSAYNDISANQSLRHILSQAYFARNNPVDFLLHNGDSINGFSPRKMSESDANDVTQAMITANKPFFLVQGNHDDNSGFSGKTFGLATNEFFGWGSIADVKDKLWTKYLTDYPSQYNPYGKYIKNDIVFIMLNSSDVPYMVNPNGKRVFSHINNMGYGQKQIDWLIKTLNSVSASQTVVVFSHGILQGTIGNQTPINGNLVRGIIEAFQNSGKFSETGTYLDGEVAKSKNVNIQQLAAKATVDFTGKQSNRVAAVMFGHGHADHQINLNHVNYFETTSSNWRQASRYKTTQLGSSEEDAWEVVVVDTKARTINLIRYGYGKDRKATW